MKTYQQKGYSTIAAYNDAVAAQNEAKAKALGFANAEEMSELTSKGYRSKNEYIEAKRKIVEAQNIQREEEKKARERESAAATDNPIDLIFLQQKIIASQEKQQAIISTFTPELYGVCSSVAISLGVIAVRAADADPATAKVARDSATLMTATLGYYRSHRISTGYPASALDGSLRAFPIQGGNIPEAWLDRCLEVLPPIWRQ